MSGMNQHADAIAVRAQQEITIMFSLLDQPKTPAQLCKAVGLSTNRVGHILRGLYKAECIRKRPGSHVVELVAPF